MCFELMWTRRRRRRNEKLCVSFILLLLLSSSLYLCWTFTFYLWLVRCSFIMGLQKKRIGFYFLFYWFRKLFWLYRVRSFMLIKYWNYNIFWGRVVCVYINIVSKKKKIYWKLLNKMKFWFLYNFFFFFCETHYRLVWYHFLRNTKKRFFMCNE